MTIQGTIVIDILGLCLIALIINLARTQRLYVGYAAVWLISTAGLLLVISLPPLTQVVTKAVGALFPVSALTLLAFVFIFVLLIFFSVKLTTISERQAQLVQALGVKDLLLREEQGSSYPESELTVADSSSRTAEQRQ
jgi:hypothetical protein